MRTYIQPVTEIHETQLMQVVMVSLWDEKGDEGQFSNTFDFEEDKKLDAPIHNEKWDRF